MLRSARSAGPLVLSAFVAAALAAGTSGDENAEVPTVREAIGRSLPYLERDGDAWMKGTLPVQDGQGCVSCHQVPFALWSLREAQRAGVPVPLDRLQSLEDRALEFISRPGIGRVMMWTPLLLGHGTPEPPAAEPWSGFRESVVSAQEGDGLWQAKGQFPTQKRPRVESDAVATLWTLLALAADDVEGAAASRLKARERIDELGEGESGEWALAKLLVEDASGEKEAARERLRKLLATQESDGGWSFTPGDPSNAYSTGQSLYALRQIGLEEDHPAVRRAVGYLLESQKPDGTWAVPSRLISAKPSSGKDYIYEYWGTAWAVIGLSKVVPHPPPPA